MQLVSGKAAYHLYMKSVTWYKDSHSLFDYESNKISADIFSLPLSTRTITLYRKRTSCKVIAVDSQQQKSVDQEAYQFLTCFEVEALTNSKINLQFFNEQPLKLKKLNSDRVNTEESTSNPSQKEQDTYLIVRKQKDSIGQQKGYKLIPGQSIKLGRVEFYVSQICTAGKITTAKSQKERFYGNRQVMKHDGSKTLNQKGACKICLEQTEDKDNFLFNPCKCSGSCGTVHLDCLLQWIHVKVKKQVIGGTLHYNFQKFQCEVCKSDLPIVIQTEQGVRKELLPVERPQDNYMILEGACEKTKSVMVIKNVPEGGIKLGRGHQCEIRITDISVSRNHSLIKFIDGEFVVFDNKSKFGTLVKQQKLELEVSTRIHQGIQIGRSVITFDLRKQRENRKGSGISIGASQPLISSLQK